MARLIAIDYGTKRTGLAVTDPLGIIASPLETVETKQLERYLADYFAKEEVSTIVVGHPRQMSGEPSETMRYIQPLMGRLRHVCHRCFRRGTPCCWRATWAPENRCWPGALPGAWASRAPCPAPPSR